MKRDFINVVIIFLVTFIIYSYFLFTTESLYRVSPGGDAKIYTFMAIHYKDPSSITYKIPVCYASRMLSSLIVGAMTSREIPKFNIKNLSHPDLLVTDFYYFKLNISIRDNWLILNFIANFLTVFFLYLAFRHLGFSNILSVGLPISFMTFFIPVRLYIRWSPMTDPLGFFFLAALFYFLLKDYWIGFLIFAFLTVMVRENNLLLLPSFWTLLITKKISLKRKATYLTLSFIPIALFFYLRSHPYYPAQIILPNTRFKIPSPVTLPHWISDYSYLIFYHLRLLYRNFMHPNLLLMPFYVFGPSIFIIFGEKEIAWSFLKRNIYFIPFVVATLFIGIAIDRQLFYLFPIVFCLAGEIIQRNIKGRVNLLVFLLYLYYLNIWLYDGLTRVTERNGLFCDTHQLEYIFEKGKLFYLGCKTILAGFLGIVIYRFAKRKSRKNEKIDYKGGTACLENR